MTKLMLQSTHTFLIGVLLSGIAFAIAGALYVKYVRPRLIAKGLLRFEHRWSTWLANRWDMVSAAAIALFAGLWNFALDLIVVIFHVADNVFPVLSTIDLTPFTLPDWVRTSIQLGSALLPAIRAAWMAVQASKQPAGP